MLESKIEWIEASKASRLLANKPLDIKMDPDQWKTAFDWFCDMAMKFKIIAKKYDNI